VPTVDVVAEPTSGVTRMSSQNSHEQSNSSDGLFDGLFDVEVPEWAPERPAALTLPAPSMSQSPDAQPQLPASSFGGLFDLEPAVAGSSFPGSVASAHVDAPVMSSAVFESPAPVTAPSMPSWASTTTSTSTTSASATSTAPAAPVASSSAGFGLPTRSSAARVEAPSLSAPLMTSSSAVMTPPAARSFPVSTRQDQSPRGGMADEMDGSMPAISSDWRDKWNNPDAPPGFTVTTPLTTERTKKAPTFDAKPMQDPGGTRSENDDDANEPGPKRLTPQRVGALFGVTALLTGGLYLIGGRGPSSAPAPATVPVSVATVPISPEQPATGETEPGSPVVVFGDEEPAGETPAAEAPADDAVVFGN
jgi:hypothetical protein